MLLRLLIPCCVGSLLLLKCGLAKKMDRSISKSLRRRKVNPDEAAMAPKARCAAALERQAERQHREKNFLNGDTAQ
jgi:hypothetical protein